MFRKLGGRGLKSVANEYKNTKIKSAVKLHCNADATMAAVRSFEELAIQNGRHSIIKDAKKYAAEELDLARAGSSKQVRVIEMSCPWLENRESKDFKKTMKYRLELTNRYPKYKVNQYNIIVDVLGGCSKEVEQNIKSL